MSVLSASSEIILRHPTLSQQDWILLSGDIQDDLARQLPTTTQVWTTDFIHYQQLYPHLGDRVYFGLLPTATMLSSCKTLIYFWPKSKQEALFQLSYLLSSLPSDGTLWIVGENRSGVRSIEKLFIGQLSLQKVDTARRCSLYSAKVLQPCLFDLQQWWRQYTVAEAEIHALPGVFSHEKLDAGSRLLLENLPVNLSGSLLDLGCGAGVLATVIAQKNPHLTSITLCDSHAAALASSQATLSANHLPASVIASNVFSMVTQRFDYIISNPPFHQGLKTHYDAAKTLIYEAPNYLKSGGQLYLVANSFLPYGHWLNDTFGQHQHVARNAQFTVYTAQKRPSRSR